MVKKQKSASSYNMPKSDAHKVLSFSNGCHSHKESVSGATKVNFKTRESSSSEFAVSESSYSFHEVNQKRYPGDHMNGLKLLFETHKQQTIVEDNIFSFPYISTFEESACSYNRADRMERFAYTIFKFSNNQSKQILLETTKISVGKKKSWNTDVLSEAEQI